MFLKHKCLKVLIEEQRKIKSREVNNSLISQGYKAVHYSSELENLFEVKNGDCAEIEEFKPAIVKTIDEKESLILKGGVVLPHK